jgi:hypothetical protein
MTGDYVCGTNPLLNIRRLIPEGSDDLTADE